MSIATLKANLKAIFTNPPVGDPADSSAQGMAEAIIQEMGGSVLSDDTPAALGDTASPGTAFESSRADHVHIKPTPAEIGAAAATHSHGAATTSVAGFMSNTDKAKLDGITAGATAVSLASTAPANLGASAAVGTGTTAARDDHVHPLQTSVSGNAGTASKLATSRKIGSVDFDGSSDIEIPIENYSTTEKRIGTWIDGKPLYRKVINFGALPDKAQKNVAHGISNIDKTIRLYGNAEEATQTLPLPHVYGEGGQYQISLWQSHKSVISILTASDRTKLTAIVFIEYTKTTD